MNRKERTIDEVLNIVIEECGYSFYPLTKEDIKGKRGNTYVQRARCIFVTMLMFLNYEKSVIAHYLGRSEQAIDDILYAAHQFRCTKEDAWTYRTSEADVTKRCEQFKDINNPA